jgi:tRNA (cytosine38-C5)-methyltransferase
MDKEIQPNPNKSKKDTARMDSDNSNKSNNKRKQPASDNCGDSSSLSTADDPIMKSTKTNIDEEEIEIKYVEFYSGIGGWTMALQESLDRLGPLLKLSSPSSSSSKSRIRRRRYKLKRLAALDHSDLCVQVFAHNFDKKKDKEESENENENKNGDKGGTIREKQRREKQKQKKQNGRNKKQQKSPTFSIERLSIRQIEEWSADIWCMSPPCQPHTRQHNNNNNSEDDPRSKSFLKICEWLDKKKDDINNSNNSNNYCLHDEYLPSIIFLENVIGFEVSNSFERWTSALKSRNYLISNFHLTPTQIQIPNDRPRYYCVAIRLSSKQNLQTMQNLQTTEIPSAESLLSYFGKMDDNNDEENMNIGEDGTTTTTTTTTFKPPVPPRIWKSIPELCVTSEDAGNSSKRTTEILPISYFLDNNQNNRLSSSSIPIPIPIPIRREDLYVPEKVLKNKSSWCFDIVSPTDHRSSCFTHSYGRYIKGTGSILYENDVNAKLLLPPSEREFCNNWINEMNIDVTKLRYFSGTELARLFGFPTTKFEFPPQITNKQQWKLIGNSLNVGIASKLIELGFLLRYYYYNNEEEEEYHHQHQQHQQKQQQQNDVV